MQVDAPGADVGEQPDDVVGRQQIADRFAEGIAAAVADRPKTEGELMFGTRKKWVLGHDAVLAVRAWQSFLVVSR